MFEKILARLGATLDESNLPYMIIGGQAVLLYGEPRLTRDIDITLGVGRLISVNLGLKNPNAKNDISHRPPEVLVASILGKERRIFEIIGRIKALLEKPS
jgi:hypothetical protein